jgi:hypothetical protein
MNVRYRVNDMLLHLLFLWFCHIYLLIGRRGPFRVRALVRVRWPRSGKPRR